MTHKVKALRRQFEAERSTLPPKALELGEVCLLHIENYKPNMPPVVRQRAIEAIDAFAEALRMRR